MTGQSEASEPAETECRLGGQHRSVFKGLEGGL
jgi:hypothetical protein